MNGQPGRPEADAADDEVSATAMAEEQASGEAGAPATDADPETIEVDLQAFPRFASP